MVHRVPCSVAVGRNSRKAFRTIVTNTSGVKKSCLNLLTRCNISFEELRFYMWLFDTDQSEKSSKCAQPASANADTVSANESDVMSEDSESEVLLTIDQLRDLQNLRSSAQISDVLQKITNIGSIENKDVGRNMCSSQKSDSTSSQRNIHPCGSNDSVDKDVWGFSSDDEGGSTSSEESLCCTPVSITQHSHDKQSNQPDLSAASCYKSPTNHQNNQRSNQQSNHQSNHQSNQQSNHQSNQQSIQQRVDPESLIESFIPCNHPAANCDNAKQQPMAVQPTAELGIAKPSEAYIEKEIIVLSDSDSCEEEMAQKKARPAALKSLTTESQHSTLSKSSCNSGDLFASDDVPAMAATTQKKTDVCSSPAQATAALSALESRNVKKRISWMNRPYRPHKDATSIWMSSPIGGKAKKPKRKSKSSARIASKKRQMLGLRDTCSSTVVELGKKKSVKPIREAKRKAKVVKQTPAVLVCDNPDKPAIVTHLRRSPRKVNNMLPNTHCSAKGCVKQGGEGAKQQQFIQSNDVEKQCGSTGDRKCTPAADKRKRSINGKKSDGSGQTKGRKEKRKSTPSTSLINSHTPKGREPKVPHRHVLSSNSAKLSASFERQSKIDAIRNIQICQMEIDDHWDPPPHTNPGRKPHKDNNRVNGEVCTTPRKQSPRSSLNVRKDYSVAVAANTPPQTRSLSAQNSVSTKVSKIGAEKNKPSSSCSANATRKLMNGLSDVAEPTINQNIKGHNDAGNARSKCLHDTADLLNQNNNNSCDGRHTRSIWSDQSLNSDTSQSVSQNSLWDEISRCFDISDTSSSDEDCFTKVKSQMELSSGFHQQRTRQIPEPIVGNANGINYKFQPVIDGDVDPILPVLESRGYLKIQSLVLPYVVINGFKYIQVTEAAKLFSRCVKRCSIPRKVLLQKHWIIAFLTFEQVNQLDKVRGEDNSSASSGDAVIRAKDLLEQLTEIENEIGQLHKSRGRKLRCSYYNPVVQ